MNVKIQEFVCRQNIEKYERLLGTQLTELERKYVQQRLIEERGLLASLRPRVSARAVNRILLAVVDGLAFATIVMSGPALGL